MSELSEPATGYAAGGESPWTKVALAASGALLVVGCSTPEQPSEPVISSAPTTVQEAVCSPTDTPVNAEQYLCAKRLTGVLDIVVAADLPTKFKPTLDYGDPATLDSLSRYITGNLAEATDNIIKLEPRIIPMSADAKAEVQKRNPNGCIESEKKSQNKNLGAVVRDTMPETRAAAQVLVLGGEACTSPEGGGIGGVARYEKTARYSEVYTVNELSGGPAKKAGTTPLSLAGGHGIHEILHNYGFNHAGAIFPKEKIETDLSKQSDTVAPLDIMKGEYSFDEYGLWDNAMSNHDCPQVPGTGCKPRDLLNAVQRDYLVDGSKPDHKPDDLEMDRVYLSMPEELIVEQGGHKKGISFPIPPAYEDYTQIDAYRFNRISFIPDLAEKRVSVILSDEHITSEIGIAELASYQLGNNKPQVFTIGDRELTVTFKDNRVELSATA